MSTESSRLTKEEQGTEIRQKASLPFNQINRPGTYYSHDTGWLYRLPEKSIAAGESPLISIVSKTEPMVTKISDDPAIPLNKAREVCSDLELDVDF